MGKFEGTLICTDLDGTLFRADKSISRENLDAIEYFKSEGGIFTFITGRVPFTSTAAHEAIKPNAPIGCLNGGAIYDFAAGDYVWRREFSRDGLELVEFATKRLPHIGAQINTFHNLYFVNENEAMALFRKVTGYPNKVCGLWEIDEPLAKVVFGDTSPDNIQELSEVLKEHPRYGEYDYIRSEKTLYEILPKGTSKGDVFPRLCKYLGIDPAHSVAVGDYDNDASMLRAAGVGVAVANATRAALDAADYVTVSNEEHAIARIISDIENNSLFFYNRG